MKKEIVVTLLVACLALSATAQTSAPDLEKSKRQKTWATVLTLTGSALIVGGIISYDAESYTSYYPGKTVGTLMMIGGTGAVAGGIILFSKSKNNSLTGTRTTGLLNLQMVPHPAASALTPPVPMVSLTMRF